MQAKTPAIAALLALLFCGPTARGAEVTELTTTLYEKPNLLDAHLSVGYRLRNQSGVVQREVLGADARQSGVQMGKDLRYSETTNIINIRGEIGLWKELQLHLEIPIIVSNTRTIGFDDDVNVGNSTTVNDKLFDASGLATNARDIGGTDVQGGLPLPTRAGLDQIHLGLSYAILSQRRDPTKPTWTVGFEGRIAVGAPKRYNPQFAPGDSQNPRQDLNGQTNKSVGRGIHQLHFFTTVSRRFRFLDPWFHLFYMAPVATGGSQFQQTNFPTTGQRRSGPRHIAGAQLGTEIVPWEVPKKHHKLSIELSTKITAVLDGRGYSPIWELFANNPRLSGPCTPDFLNPNPQGLGWANGVYCNAINDTLPFPGITNIENYMNISGTLALDLQFSRYFHARLGLSVGQNTAHFITFADQGRSPDDSGTINGSDPTQVNPLWRPIIDTVGHRYRVESATNFDFFFSITGKI